MKPEGCFVIIGAIVIFFVSVFFGAAMTLFEQIKGLLRKPDTVTVASADFLSVITNRLDSVTVITYTLKGEDK